MIISWNKNFLQYDNFTKYNNHWLRQEKNYQKKLCLPHVLQVEVHSSWTLVRAFIFKAALHLLAFGVFPIAFPRLFLHLFFNFSQVSFKLLQLESLFITEGNQFSHPLLLWRSSGSNKRPPLWNKWYHLGIILRE